MEPSKHALSNLVRRVRLARSRVETQCQSVNEGSRSSPPPSPQPNLHYLTIITVPRSLPVWRNGEEETSQ